MLLAYRDGCYTQTALAEATKLSVSRVSRLIAKLEAKGKTSHLFMRNARLLLRSGLSRGAA